MNRNIARTTLTLLSFAVLLASLAPAAHAATCSTATAAGKYGASDSGTVVGIGPRATVSLLTLEVAGNIKAKVTEETIYETQSYNENTAHGSVPAEFSRLGQHHVVCEWGERE